MTSRREFITLLGGAVAWPLAALGFRNGEHHECFPVFAFYFN
jgi:hypothetical protein